MRVATYNICGSRARRHPGHIERIAEVIRSLRADVVGLQEVYDGSPRGPYGDQPRQLEELTGMRCIFWSHLSLRGNEYGNAVLTHGKVGPATMYRLPGALLQPRALVEVEIEVAGLTLDFFCTHLVHFGAVMARSRGRQLAEVARRVSARNRPRILVGDLNTGWSSLDMEALARAGLYPVCKEEVRTYPARRPRYCLDHIFTARAWQCLGVQTVNAAPSDHRPLIADLVPAPAGHRPPGEPQLTAGAAQP